MASLALSALALTLAARLPSTMAAPYTLQQDWSGSTFFQDWSFTNHADNTTSGDVQYANATYAQANRLAYVNEQGQAIVAVDNTSFVPYNEKRLSVRMTSDYAFAVGSVFVLDATHMPYGCSVWPSFWSLGEDWPSNGEIDIVEGVNMQPRNQMAIHAGGQTTCTLSDQAPMTGTVSGTQCVNSNATGTSGCTVVESSPNSYGAAFAANGGGVFAAELAESGISIWFFERDAIPADLSTSSAAAQAVDTSSWGRPSANYSSATCDISRNFGPQNLVLTITLCGAWAGEPSVYNSTCTPGVCYLDNVINEGNPMYDEAYFAINSIKVFGSGTAPIARAAEEPATRGDGVSTGNSAAVSPSATKSAAGQIVAIALPGVLALGLAVAVLL